MDTGQRLAAYLSGDLDAGERTALEAELAGDTELRAQLERIRATDQALANLPEVDLPDGLSGRLDTALAPELERVLGDELAARRARRAVPRWLPAAGAAAALVLVVGAGVVVSGLGGLGDRGEDATMLGAPETADMAEGDAARDMMADGSVAGPVVTASGRTLGPDDLASLAADPGIVTPVGPWLAQGDPDAVALSWRAALGGTSERSASPDGDGTPPDGQADTDEDDRTFTQETLPSTLPPLNLQGQISPDDLDDVARCLGVLFDGATGPIIPLYAELAFDTDGIPVIVYVALSADRVGDLTVVEVWKVDRSSCDLREFAQHDG